MYKYLLIILLTSCSQVDIKAGASFLDNNVLDKEANPHGIVRINYETEKDTDIFCEHISSIPISDDGIGLNHCGFLFKL